jgi:hypothetical protein
MGWCGAGGAYTFRTHGRAGAERNRWAGWLSVGNGGAVCDEFTSARESGKKVSC